MKSQAANNLLATIDQAIADFSGYVVFDPIRDSYFARFLTVYICGIYEETIETIFNEMVAKTSHSHISRYIRSSIDKGFRNPDIEKICSLCKQFDPSWAFVIKNLSVQSLQSFDSIVKNKNYIAHGSPCTITLNDITTYYHDSRIVVETLDNVLL